MHWLAELDGRRVAVEVPASSANLGAGYDVLGMALDLTNRVEVEVRGWADGSVELTVDGEGAGELTADRGNRFVRGLEAAIAAARGPVPEGVGWRVEMRNGIPLSRGLGSSAAATIAGVVAGNALAGEPLTEAELLRLATGIEGHPDNAAAALLGGFVVAADLGTAVHAVRFDVPRDLRAVLFIPDRRLSTADMRAALPADVPLADAVANLGRVGLGIAGVATGQTELLAELMRDRLHEPYRAAAYPELPALADAARQAGAIGACLSGAGSTVLALADRIDTIAAVEAAFRSAAGGLGLPGRVAVVSPRNAGARVVGR